MQDCQTNSVKIGLGPAKIQGFFLIILQTVYGKDEVQDGKMSSKNLGYLCRLAMATATHGNQKINMSKFNQTTEQALTESSE